MPRTAIEASSFAIPIITTDTVGCKEVVDNKSSGYLVPIKDTKQITNALKELLNNQELYKKMSKNARKKAISEFDVSIIVKEHILLYNLISKT